ncbi:rRNA processing protein Utp6 [Cordyceps fumosorosea ARSEF 2679]|uniref:rRNA processing protein Utp6 n=1 Tax=Cordyceps fumosorosea (strain ARSEF 2679) TaxID=1081104 RepID=A0A167NXQ2_CORFA|nr:rRNA processing protein Utp6 [Cordyceps fumosorosea ARSEF 2679]OAA56062.1 rRNA processing protein Utp6 [Cordyceps fumosorosea ARSEF 2679]
MAGVAEKARFYLERSVPQLREWEEREIFSKDEIRTIVQKRNQHEHKVLAPGNTPHDWSAYARWEQSLEALRSKRCQRLRVRHLSSSHAGQGRVLAIYERAVARHPGHSALWREYLAYTAGLWAAAGRRAAHVGDMPAARAYFMRGCRFCTADDRLWIEYARCEMEWLARMEDKKGKGKGATERRTDDDEELRIDDSDAEDEDEDGVILPEPTRAQAKVIDDDAAQRLAAKGNPALDGAIPVAIFDVARKQAFFAPAVAERFFLMLGPFRSRAPASHARTAEFPRGLRESLSRLASQLAATTDRAALVRRTEAWIDECLAVEGLDEAIRTVLEHTRSSLAEEEEEEE